MRHSLRLYLPEWAQDWLDVIVPALQIALIVFCAWLLHRMLRRLVRRASAHYGLPADMSMLANGVLRWAILLATALLVLERLGVSAAVMWTAFTGFATVAAVAFFAAWSVLSNLFCAMLIFTVGPFRVGDVIEVLDTQDTGGARGRVIDINLLYTTLEDVTPGTAGTLLQIPNTMVFQRVVRRWRPGQAVLEPMPKKPADTLE
ncbi:MAG: mechanosensitive ion channel family protein [Simplicispira suum]|uniref:mechanosensitive ion channel family protein n=1 Tax=Simplicispira suum TaxID=2109915 RepID=UPI001C6C42AC|nr:mechanosensitive ion channel family protein [Simplicispira suum]MBW7834495.1 mechanosensitive ion channel family protein [Simplicispira suum]